ncbi:MAG: Rrf2 family transcriptional regulator [Chloroflexota bacterium]
MSYSLALTQSLFMTLYVASKIDQGEYDFISTQQISQELNIPPSTAGMILRRLNRAGLIDTREGVNGGVRLAKPPESVTMLDVFEAIEQERPMFQTNIELPVTGEKRTRVQQAIFGVLESGESAMKNRLRQVTMRDLMNTVRG